MFASFGLALDMSHAGFRYPLREVLHVYRIRFSRIDRAGFVFLCDHIFFL
jgi:hypothetical protein